MTPRHPLLLAGTPTGLHILGEWTQPNDAIEVRSPYSGEVVAVVASADADDVDAAVRDAAAPLPPMEIDARARILERAAELVVTRAEALATTITLEAGKPIRQARGEVARTIETLRFSAAAARTIRDDMIPTGASAFGAGTVALWVREPIGVVGAIAPFNFPLNLVAHKVAPAIAAGCPVVLKPAENAPLSALSLAAILLEAGLPPRMLQVVNGPGETVGAAIVDHPDVALVSFTGSAAVGWGIRARATKKDVALELGNATPVIVAADADVAAAARRVAQTGYTHAGQSCISVQRVYVARDIYGEFLDRLQDAVSRLVVGDPLDEATDVGPVIDGDARARILAWVEEAVRAGAERLGPAERDAPLIAPVILSGITPTMRVSREEIFGPVVGVAPFETIDDAITLANQSPTGLQAGIFTARVDLALQWSARLRFGAVTINESPTFRVDNMPYGGVKESGNTREGPRFAIERMSERKLVVMRVSGSGA